MKIRFSVNLGMSESISYTLDTRGYRGDINDTERLSEGDKQRIHTQISKVMNALSE